MIIFSDHSEWMGISAVTPYSFPCLREMVEELNLKWFDILRAMNDKFLTTILEIFTRDKRIKILVTFMIKEKLSWIILEILKMLVLV